MGEYGEGMGRVWGERVWEGISMEARESHSLESHSLEGSIGRSTSTDDSAKVRLIIDMKLGNGLALERDAARWTSGTVLSVSFFRAFFSFSFSFFFFFLFPFFLFPLTVRTRGGLVDLVDPA